MGKSTQDGLKDTRPMSVIFSKLTTKKTRKTPMIVNY